MPNQYTNQTPGTLTHKLLYTQNAEYDPKLNTKLSLLYQGGFEIQKHARLFLDRISGVETEKAYTQRLRCVAYVPYLSEFITQFSASLFSEELEVKRKDQSTLDPYWKAFVEDCDLNGTSLHQFMQQCFEKASSELAVYVGYDFPTADTLPNSLLEEEELGLANAYLYTIPYENLIDWKCDPRNNKFLWTKEFEEIFPETNPLKEPTHFYRFRLRTMDNGLCVVKTYDSERMPIAKKFMSQTVYKLTSEIRTSFPDVNILALRIPKAYHTGQQIAPLCQEHYQRRSFLVSNANKTCVSIGVITVGPEISSPGDSLPVDIAPLVDVKDARKQLQEDGWLITRTTDKWTEKVDIVESKGESHKFVAEDLQKLVEQMMQTLRQMQMSARASHGSNLNRSAASKQIDQHGTSMILSVFERIIKDFTRHLLIQISAGKNNVIPFSMDGLSIAAPPVERKDLVSEVQSLGVNIASLPSIFQSKYLYRIATELLDNELSEEEKIILQEEIQVLADSHTSQQLNPAPYNKPTNSDTNSDGYTSTSQTDDSQPLVDEQGNQPGYPGMHLMSGEHIDPNQVFDMLADDYRDQDIEWVKSIPWRGAISVPLSSIDFSNQDNWAASQDQDHVNDFKELLQKGRTLKPIILVNEMSNNKPMALIDGHHRALAYQQLNLPALAYVGEVGSITKDMKRMHGQQLGSKQESSIQKEISNQVSKSEKDSYTK